MLNIVPVVYNELKIKITRKRLVCVTMEHPNTNASLKVTFEEKETIATFFLVLPVRWQIAYTLERTVDL